MKEKEVFWLLLLFVLLNFCSVANKGNADTRFELFDNFPRLATRKKKKKSTKCEEDQRSTKKGNEDVPAQKYRKVSVRMS